MNGYLIHFAVYTFAMIGFIVIALFVYKKSVYTPQNSRNKGFLKVESVLKLSPSKTVYVISAGEEKFLIAGDTANTTMLAKLNSNNETTAYNSSCIDNVEELPYMKKLMKKINRG